MKIKFIVPDQTPPSLNEIIGKPFGQVAGIKKSWADAIYVLAYQAGWRPAEKKGHYRNARIVLRFPDKKKRDADNFLKVLLDSLSLADLIFDDDVLHLNYTLQVKIGTGKRETEIELW